MEGLYQEVLAITLRTLWISGTATILAISWSIPLSLILISSKNRISIFIQDFFNALISLPTVVLGLALYLILSKSGPLGFLGLLYTPLAISIGQSILITPILVSMITSSFQKLRDEVWETAITLGASEFQASIALLREGTLLLIRAILAGFNRAVGELGVALIVGGNIKGFTRVLTTTIALELTKGNFELAIYLGIVLLTLSTIVTVAIRSLGIRGAYR